MPPAPDQTPGAGCGAATPEEAEGPWYCALPKPRIGKKIIGSKSRPIPKPTPLPKLFATSMQRMIQMIKFTKGMNIRSTHQPGRPAILHKRYVFRIGTIDARPGCPAFVKTFQSAAIIKMANANQQIQKTGPGALPCDEYEYSACASSDRGWVRRFCISDSI